MGVGQWRDDSSVLALPINTVGKKLNVCNEARQLTFLHTLQPQTPHCLCIRGSCTTALPPTKLARN